MQPSILKDLDRNNSFITVPKLLSDGNDSHTSLTAWGWTHDSDLHLIISFLLLRSPLICKNYLEQGPFSKGPLCCEFKSPSNVFTVCIYLLQTLDALLVLLTLRTDMGKNQWERLRFHNSIIWAKLWLHQLCSYSPWSQSSVSFFVPLLVLIWPCNKLVQAMVKTNFFVVLIFSQFSSLNYAIPRSGTHYCLCWGNMGSPLGNISLDLGWLEWIRNCTLTTDIYG